MVITNSPDISTLNVNAIWDISGTTPKLLLSNASTGVNLANISYAFTVTSPSQTIIHQGSIASPDVTGIWSAFNFYSTTPDPLAVLPANYIIAPWPMPFNQIEFSPSPFTLTVIAIDSVGNTFSQIISQVLCKPSGNLPNAVNTYGAGNVQITPDCNRGYYFFEDFTNSSYQGFAGKVQSSVLKVIFPDDNTDVAPAPAYFNSFATALVTVTFDSTLYQFVYNSTFLYDFNNGSAVLVRYYQKLPFTVNCGVDLSPLVCDYVRLLETSFGKSYDTELQKKLIQINGKMNLAMLAKSQPMAGIDLGALIEEIKSIGGFDCDCSIPSGIRALNSTNIGDYNFQIISGGGDVSGTTTVNGNNIQFTLSDKSYIFNISALAPTRAFTVLPTVSGATKTFSLNVDLGIFSADILNSIKSSQTLVTLFNSIVTTGASNFSLIVDGGNIFQTSASCNYSYLLQGVPTDTTFAILSSLKINGTAKAVNYSFNLSTLPALQNYLNGLGYGTFVVSNTSGVISIISIGNTFNIGDLNYKIGTTNFIATFTKTCTGFIPKSANEVVQDIINYLSNISDAQVITSHDYTICYIDNTTKKPATVTLKSGTELNIFLAAFLDKQCTSVNYIMSLNAVTCDSVTNLFPQAVSIVQANDFIMGTKQGSCARIYPVEFGQAILELGSKDANFMNTLCTLIKSCQTTTLCDPYSVYNVTVAEHTPADNMMDITVTFAHPAAISHLLEYARVDNIANPVYTSIPSVLPLASPYKIMNLSDGQYIVRMTPKYADLRTCMPTSRSTDACYLITSFNAVMSADNLNIYVNYTAGSAFVKVHVDLPSGGIYEIIVANAGTQITIPNPSAGTGIYNVYMIPYCNKTTNWYGVQTAPAILTVTGSNACAAPTNLVSSSVTPTGFTESWSGVTGATSYQYRINGGGWISTGTSLTTMVSGLNSSTTYLFEVGAIIGATTCTQLASNSITTSASGATCAAPEVVNYSAVTSSSFTENWSSVSGATSYRYRINGGSWISAGTNLGATITGLSGSTSYLFEVGAIIGSTICTQYASNTVITSAAASPSFTETNNSVVGDSRSQDATVGANIVTGKTYYAIVYSHQVSYVTVSGDTPSSVAANMAAAINATTTAQWNSAGSAPAAGTTSYPPTASSSGAVMTVVLNSVNQFAFGVS